MAYKGGFEPPSNPVLPPIRMNSKSGGRSGSLVFESKHRLPRGSTICTSPKPPERVQTLLEMMESGRPESVESTFSGGAIGGGTFITELHKKSDDIDDSDYDTDLEIEAPLKAATEKRKRKVVYRKACSKNGLTPISYYIRNMENPELRMRHRGLAEKEAQALSLPLQVEHLTETLDLEGNWLGPEGIIHFSDLLRDNLVLTKLNLSNNRLGNKGAKILRLGLLTNKKIENLNLAANGFSDKDAKFIAEIIEKNDSVKYLNLSQNDFNSEGGMALGPAIGQNRSIVDLDLSWNQIRLKGCEAIGEGLRENKKLKKLNLNKNGFAVFGSIAIADALLIGNNILEELDLSNNRIPISAAGLIGKMFTTNYALKVLKMSSNPMTTAGALALIRDIEDSEVTNLERFELRDVTVTDEFMDSVDAIKERRSFECEVGHVTSSQNRDYDAPFQLNLYNPLEIMLIHMETNHLRVVDLFRGLDKDGSGALDRNEFVKGLKNVDTPLSSSQMDDLIAMLDKDGDGEIDISEILNINTEFKNVKMKAKRRVKARNEEKKNPAPRLDYRQVGLMAVIRERQRIERL
ncbi:leucine-rich repeat-containing protein 74B-like [Lineus longissimus]|uniref:leucine-rich repeat-containing protein 74B-like n=1 Tax=Lineus longissimus TaxID=88925 RepID=UPI002B4C27BD